MQASSLFLAIAPFHIDRMPDHNLLAPIADDAFGSIAAGAYCRQGGINLVKRSGHRINMAVLPSCTAPLITGRLLVSTFHAGHPIGIALTCRTHHGPV